MNTQDCLICRSECNNSKKIWECPDCKNKFHYYCLCETISFNFNKNFCPYCQRIFTDLELKDILTLKEYKNYIKYVVNINYESYIKDSIGKINEIRIYLDKFNNLLKCHPIIYSYLKRWKDHYGFKYLSDNQIKKLSKIYSTDGNINDIKIYYPTCKSIIDYEDLPKIFDDLPIKEFELLKEFLEETPKRIIKTICLVKFSNHKFNTDEIFRLLSDEIENQETPEIFMNCVKCNGIVNKYKKIVSCINCGEVYCENCGEIKDSINHVCKNKNKETFQIIKSQTKPCPSCGVRIQKSSGCAQMFCTNCHNGFDWNTGEIIKSNFHNPHRIEWLKSLNKSTEVSLEDVINPILINPNNNCATISDRITYLERTNNKNINILNLLSFLSNLNERNEYFESKKFRIELEYNLLFENDKKNKLKRLLKLISFHYRFKNYHESFIENMISIISSIKPLSKQDLYIELIMELLTDLFKTINEYSKILEITDYSIYNYYFKINDWAEYLIQFLGGITNPIPEVIQNLKFKSKKIISQIDLLRVNSKID